MLFSRSIHQLKHQVRLSNTSQAHFGSLLCPILHKELRFEFLQLGFATDESMIPFERHNPTSFGLYWLSLEDWDGTPRSSRDRRRQRPSRVAGKRARIDVRHGDTVENVY